jgi:hypothetical protein
MPPGMTYWVHPGGPIREREKIASLTYKDLAAGSMVRNERPAGLISQQGPPCSPKRWPKASLLEIRREHSEKAGRSAEPCSIKPSALCPEEAYLDETTIRQSAP